ncbi:MAG: ribonuclease HI [Prevotellaceae bacterium]|jgi:ribonuclease HI|nr:ribonuclease HI [Prevotellaceae bacterium]
MASDNFEVTIYTDGAASGNPGPGGYGIILMSNGHQKELSGGFAHTTNNRMELMAVIVALEALKYDNCRVHIFSDSSYVVNAVEKGWIAQWERTAFKKKKNADLWRRFLKTYCKHQVQFHWLKGHAGHPLNERCDQLAVAASMQPELPEDKGYLLSIESGLLM